jgi:hypothetical protein
VALEAGLVIAGQGQWRRAEVEVGVVAAIVVGHAWAWSMRPMQGGLFP